MEATLRICLDRLANATSTASWGYFPGATPQVEPTCLALLALGADRSRFADLIDRGVASLLSWQTEEGSFPVHGGREEAIWPTALALLVLTSFGSDKEAERRAVRWLLEVRGAGVRDPRQHRQLFDIDPDIVGWPWTEGAFSWTEPTSWACLALRRAGWGSHPRVQEGVRLLLDRAFDDGGVNCGNRCVFGRPTKPVPTMTALMVLACDGLTDHPRVEAARAYLARRAVNEQDLEHLCWTRLALDDWNGVDRTGLSLRDLDERIVQAFESRDADPLLPLSTPRIALTALALGAKEYHPFRIEEEPTASLSNGERRIRRPRPPWGERMKTTFQGLVVRALNQMRDVATPAAVHIAKADGYESDLASVVRDQYETFRSKVPLKNRRVVLKPNLVEYHADKVINTHPHVIAAMIELCRHEGAKEVVVAEGPGHWRNTDYLVTASGLGDVLRHYRVPFVDLNHDQPVALDNLGRLTRLERIYMAATVAHADVLVSLPKLKTHHWAGVTLSLKNLFGTLPGICYGWPKNDLHRQGIDASIVDIALTRPPDLVLVDGIIGMEGDGPLNGTATPVRVLVMGCDAVAVDATCCRIMCLAPERVGHLQLAQRYKLGQVDERCIHQIGEPIAAVARPFDTSPGYEFLRQTVPEPEMASA